MKLSLLLLTAGLLQIYAGGYAQSTRLSFESNGKQVAEVLREIEDISDFRFFYQREQVDVARSVNLKVEDQTIDEILYLLFPEGSIQHKVYADKLILLAPEEILAEANGALMDEFVPQPVIIKGTVTGPDGEPLLGVTIYVKGTSTGSITDLEGNYSISVLKADATLVFSYIGMLTQEIAVGDQETINVSLEEDFVGIEEVVVVGYGTQKKVNLTGSVSTAKIEELEKKTVSQASQLLSGEMSGVTVSQQTGNPGNDETDIRIRGLGTFSDAGNSPLVIVDGFPSSIDAVDPNNIASMSVLKDAASASIYGSRAANGVILITTREGKEGQLNISYNGYVGWQSIVKMPDFVDSWTYAEAYNEVLANMGQGAAYTEAEIDLFKAGTDQDNYPNKHHYKDLLNSGNGLQTKHNLTFSGGSEKSKYLFSAGYLKQNGLVDRNTYDRYDMQLNLSQQVRKNILMEVRLSGYNSLAEEPVDKNLDPLYNVINGAMRLNNAIPGKRSDGTYGYLSDFAPEAYMDSKSFAKNNAKNFMGNVSLIWEIIDGLSITGRGNYRLDGYNLKQYVPEIEINPTVIYTPSKLNNEIRNNTDLTLELLAQYDKRIKDDHHILILAGASRETYNRDWLIGYRDNLPGDVLYELDAGSEANMQNEGSAFTWKLASFFGRLNYSYKDKYLIEGNIRYDGSSRFAAENRWGLFPSVSAGWRVSGEEFFKNGVPWVDDLKLRASIGTLGNQQIGNYPYQKTIELGANYPWGGILQSGGALTTLPYDGITWETTTITDVGVDLTIFKNRLSITADYFYKKTDDILYTISVSNLLGLEASEQNAGSVENRGWDFEVNYNQRIGDFSFSIRPNFSIVTNEVLSLANVDEDINNGLFVGSSVNAIYGYEADGLFIDQDDIDSYVTQPYAAEPGLIRYKDISGPDGVPDGIVNTDDRKVIGSGIPKYTYGAGITAKYKGFDLYVQLQGLAGYSKLPHRWMWAFYNGGNIQQWQYDERWTEENPDRNAAYPKLQEVGSGSFITEQNSSYWLMDASFFRLRNVQIGYTFPVGLIPYIKDFRIYASATNLLTFDNYWEGWDPEMNTSVFGGSGHYPLSRVITFGVNVNF